MSTASPQDLATNAGGSVSPSEKGANSGASAPARKPRSCMVCRNRKVRCDKQSPCSNCRRAGIACLLPPTDRPPRWARRLERLNASNASPNATAPSNGAPAVDHVMDRLRSLEGLVKDLSSQLEQANAAAGSSTVGGSSINSPSSSTNDLDGEHKSGTSASGEAEPGSVQKQLGRMVLHDAGSSRYISSGFWTRVSDELRGLEMETRGLADGDYASSDDDDSSNQTPSTQEMSRSPAERHGFLFRHNLSATSPNLQDFHPLPSQVPFLISVFAENVNTIIQMVHMPTVEKLLPSHRGNGSTELSPAHEALLFSIYYAAVTSMEDEDVIMNFGTTKSELNMRYRVGLEHALAKADFLNVPSIVLVQAFGIFLFLVRRHDSPRFVWMMTGLVIRMAQALGLHKDGGNFPDLTPYEVEIRRRVWWALCILDIRSSEDQGTDLTITNGSFDTKIPLNINDVDIATDMKHPPNERVGLTDMSIANSSNLTTVNVRKMMVLMQRDEAASMEEKEQLLSEMYEIVDRSYLQYSPGPDDIGHWVAATCSKLVIDKMTLIIFLPFLFSSREQSSSKDIHNRLLVCAIELAEYNHALNANEKARHWRWIYQTYTHWHAIVYILIDITSRPWSPLMERAWTALHSSWLIPAQTNMDKNVRIWIPLRKLMAKARRHRAAELQRLRENPQAALEVEQVDRELSVPASSGLYSAEESPQRFRERWWHLITSQGSTNAGDATLTVPGNTQAIPPNVTERLSSPFTTSPSAGSQAHSTSQASETQFYVNQDNFNSDGLSGMSGGISAPMDLGGQYFPSMPGTNGVFDGMSTMPLGWTANIFDDVDIEMDLESSDIDWYNWVETAQGMEMPPTPAPQMM